MANNWEINDAEYQKNIAMFNQLTSGQLFMDAGTARNALLRSNLPTHILSQIWALSDLDNDGRLDIREYSIAMRLALNCLAGVPLPAQLPGSLLVVPFRNTSVPNATIQPTWSGSRHGTGSPSNADRSVAEGRQLENWAIPHHNKLKYSQLFNALDKDRLGSLSSHVGRSALGLSGLPTSVLAHVWFLSDVNKDGKLSVDEYAISQFMIEMFKSGYALPKVTPPELVRMCGISSRSANNTPELEPDAEPPQKSPAPKTFEDKRQDNFSKGQAELERRRKILEEEEQRRRVEVEKKEKEEAAKRERERMEKERLAEAERQAELKRRKQLEDRKEEEERMRRLEMERRKEEEEKIKKVKMEKARIKQMQSQKQQENERLAQRQQREKTLQFQLQALDEKASDVIIDIGKAKEAVTNVTGSIDEMRSGRDGKVARIKELQEKNQKVRKNTRGLEPSMMLLRTIIREGKTYNQIEALNSKKEKYQNNAYLKLAAKREEYRKIFELYTHAKTHANSILGKLEVDIIQTNVERASSIQPNTTPPSYANGFTADDSSAELIENRAEQKFAADFNNTMKCDPLSQEQKPVQVPEGNVSKRTVDQSTFNFHDTHKCRALFAFEARSEDELSFEPGDVIIVFQSHAAEPGWRAGQLHEKVGWFPEAFVESIAAVPTPGNQPPIQNMPPNVTPSSSIDQLKEKAARKAEIASAMESKKNDQFVVSEPQAQAISHCVAQFQWRARNDDDLSFSKGDLIEILEKQDMKWKGRNPAGEVGWFPKSYVKDVGGLNTPATSPLNPALSDTLFPTDEAKYDVVPGEITAPEELYTAIYDFESVETTDLSLKVGDTIVVLEKNDEWWKGRCKEKEGIFPANYVEKAEPPRNSTGLVTPFQFQPPSSAVLCEAKVIVDFTASAPNQLGIKAGETVKIREKSATGWWEGELSRDGMNMAGWFPGDYVKVMKDITSTSSANCLRATALYDYVASQVDELSFKAGETIIVTDSSEPEWWSGHNVHNPSKTGLFPSNYVETK
uniref:Intersectin-1 n=1 Tax=Caenorhabditis tropicalis TaxID=1561998 RepID=A0A1I7V4P3_9PELO